MDEKKLATQLEREDFPHAYVWQDGPSAAGGGREVNPVRDSRGDRWDKRLDKGRSGCSVCSLRSQAKGRRWIDAPMLYRAGEDDSTEVPRK